MDAARARSLLAWLAGFDAALAEAWRPLEEEDDDDAAVVGALLPLLADGGLLRRAALTGAEPLLATSGEEEEEVCGSLLLVVGWANAEGRLAAKVVDWESVSLAKINHHPLFEQQEEEGEQAAAPHWPALVSALGAQLPPAAATALLSAASAAAASAPAPLVLQQTLQVSRPRRTCMWYW